MKLKSKVGALKKIALEIKKIKDDLGTPVPGEGNPNAKIIVIGTNPGATEIKLGRPFVGRAGKLLTKLIEDNGIKRNSVYITNIVRIKTPDNRKPTKDEIKFWKPYLLKEIDLINPKIIILLGSTAIETMLGKLMVTKVHGTEIKRDNITYVPMYHPSAGLRFKKYKVQLEEDFKQLAKKVL